MPRTYGHRSGWKPNSGVRGYGKEHVAERKRWVPLVKAGGVACAKCGQPIPPTAKWDLGHTADRTGWTGPEHQRCNRQDGARRGNKMRAVRGDLTIYSKTCVQCGQGFTTLFKRQLTCGKACAEARRRAQPIKAVTGQPVLARICVECGVMFTSSRDNQLTCSSECRTQRNRNTMREHYRTNEAYRAATIERSKARQRKSREW